MKSGSAIRIGLPYMVIRIDTMAAENLTELNKDYSVYIPSMQLASAANICAQPEKWQHAPLPKRLKPKDFNFLRADNKYWTYKYALASAEMFRGESNNAVTNKGSEAFILGDSGGYQIGKGTFKEARAWRNLPRNELMRKWEEGEFQQSITNWCERNCTFAMTLDMPLWVSRNEKNASPFRVCSTRDLTKLTVGNLRYLKDMLGRRTRGEDQCRYLNVLQGEHGSDEQSWYDAVSGYEFDGWSLAGRVGTDGGPYRILRRLLILADDNKLRKGLDWIHILKLGIPIWSPLITAMQRAIRKHINPNLTISYDSSSPYQNAGSRSQYWWTEDFTDDPRTWTLKAVRFPTTYAYATYEKKIQLGKSYCIGSGCRYCARDLPHLPATLDSPIALHLSVQDLLDASDERAGNRVRTLFYELLINHNVYTVVKSMINANDAVFAKKPHAPQNLIDACGVIEQLFEKNEKWQGTLDKNRGLLEKAVGFQRTPDVKD
jgi:hypothetical protein